MKSFGEIIDAVIEPFSPRWALERKQLRNAIKASTEYNGASTGRLRADWMVGPGSSTPPSNELEYLRNRSRDLNRNDPTASGITDNFETNIVGTGLKLQSKISGKRLGISEEKAQELRQQAENIFYEWSKKADSGNRLNFAEIQALSMRKIVEDGEILVNLPYADEPWRQIKRTVELVEGDRLRNTGGNKGYIDTQGIDLGSRGQPLAYNIRKANTLNEYQKISALDSEGRPNILHLYKSKRPGQLRGIPLFTPVLTMFKDLASYLEAEVVAARVGACLTLIFTKQDAFSASLGFMSADSTDDERLQAMAPGMVHYGNPGEKPEMFDPKRPGVTFGPFVESALRLIGAALGLPYELILKDFSKTNYSSARAALLEGRRVFKNWRTWLAGKLNQPVYDLVLEEAFLMGLFDAPNFYEFKTEYCRALWLGEGWGWVDPVKEIEASRKAIDYGLSTLADEVSGQGGDWEENLDQRAREVPREKAVGVLPCATVPKVAEYTADQPEEEVKNEI